jgi:GT2 family glycosyltransferase
MSLEDGSCCPTISILICSRDRRSDLDSIVSDLKGMKTRYPYEIIVVEETDRPRPIAGVSYFSHPVKNFGFAYARNLSVEKAAGTILVFVDDDCRIKDRWLDSLLRPFREESVVGVQGGVVVPEGTNAVGWAETILGFPGGGAKRIIASGGKVQDTTEISTLNSAYRRRVIEAVGGFDALLKWGGEDYLLAKKVSHYGKCLFVPDALVAHRARGSLLSIWHWFVRRGRAEIDVVRSRQYEMATWGAILRSSLLLKFVAVSLLSLLFPGGFAYLILVFSLFYFFVQYGRSISAWRKSEAPFKSLLILPWVKLIMDLSADVGRLKGIFRG